MFVRSMLMTAGAVLLLAGQASAVPCTQVQVHVSFVTDTRCDDFALRGSSCTTSPCLPLKNFLLVQTERDTCQFITCVGSHCGKCGPFTLPLTNTGCCIFNKGGCATGACSCHNHVTILQDGECSRFSFTVNDLGVNDCSVHPACVSFSSVSGGFAECGNNTILFNDCNPFGTAVFTLEGGDEINARFTFTFAPEVAGAPEVDASESAAPVAALLGSILLACDSRRRRVAA